MASLEFWNKRHDLGEILAQLREDERTAVAQALAEVHQEYLAYLETWRENLSESDMIGGAVLDGQIRTLRRQLGIQTEPDRNRIRELVRERVRRLRQRRKAVGR